MNNFINTTTNTLNNTSTITNTNVAIKKQRKSRYDREIEEARHIIATTTNERRKKHYEEHLAILLEDKAEKENAAKVKKSMWMAERRIEKMSDADVTRMYNRYLDEMIRRELK